jgi:hypothetical protein
MAGMVWAGWLPTELCSELNLAGAVPACAARVFGADTSRSFGIYRAERRGGWLVVFSRGEQAQ